MKQASQRLESTGVVAACVALSVFGSGRSHAQQPALRPPAVPLVASDPYLSVWSMADRLTDDTTRHWTRHAHPLVSLIRVNGKTYRLMGTSAKESLPALPQTGLRVLPTRTIYDFADSRVRVTLTFMTPALPSKLDVLARPLTYLTWEVRSVDGTDHSVEIYSSTSALLAVNTPDQKVDWKQTTFDGLSLLQAGTVDQTLLQPAGDDVRIDWGYVCAATPAAQGRGTIGASNALVREFAERGSLPADSGMPSPAAAGGNHEVVLAFAFGLGRVGAEPAVRHQMTGYDEVYAVRFLGRKLQPYWRSPGLELADLVKNAERDYTDLARECAAFDDELMADLTKAGGERYALLAALAYRQALAGCGLAADANKQPLLFAKENSSNGCVATVDVIYPAAPLFLLMGPTYAKALVAPALVYSTSPRWKFPFAPHDVGVYPQANGQVYGGGEESKNEADMMPVEESANLIILCAAIAKMDGNADFSSRWWPQLTRWEAYLEKYGEDPENQLCTDDFMGHLAHNANLSVKAILAIAAYGELCRMRGDRAAADRYRTLAREYAAHWMKAADDGDHYRIAFDKPGTWSQKYNLVWDKLLGLGIFPPQVARREVAHYKKVINRYGVPLDSRTRLTKTDWCLWSATLADNRADFEAIVAPIFDYINETSARLPFVNSYITDDPKSDGMRARPVIGGVFIKLLDDPATWKKWWDRDRTKIGTFARAPSSPRVTELVATSREHPVTWRYTLKEPAGNWTAADYDDHEWKSGAGGFGTKGTPGIGIGTTWNTSDIWLRRSAVVPATADPSRLQVMIYHDEDAEVYLNGKMAAKAPGYRVVYELVEMSAAALAAVKPGERIVIAVHCHQAGGGQGIDAGLADVVGSEP